MGELYVRKNMNYRGSSVDPCYSCCISWLCFALGANKILRGHSNYQFIFSFPIFWSQTCYMIVGGFCGGQRNLNTIFHLSFYSSIYRSSNSWYPYLLLHSTGRNNPLGLNSNPEKVPFHWYYSVKDV